jgi:hypothetical protein
MKIGDKVRIIKRLPRNTSGTFKGWDNGWEHIGLIGIINDISASGKFVVKNGKDYFGIFSPGIEIELVDYSTPDIETELFDKLEQYYEIY